MTRLRGSPPASSGQAGSVASTPRPRRRDDVVVGAVCDVDTEPGLARSASSFGAQVFGDWQELLDAGGLDMVWVCTPPRSHRAPTVGRLRARAPGLSREAGRPDPRRRAGDRRSGARAAGRLRGRLPVALRSRCWTISETLPRGSVDRLPARGRASGRRVPAVVSRPGRRRRQPARARQPSHRPRAHHRRRGPLGPGGGEQDIALARAGGDIDDAVTVAMQLESGALATLALAWTARRPPGHLFRRRRRERRLVPPRPRPDIPTLGIRPWRSRSSSVRPSIPFTRSVSRFLEAVRQGDPEHVFCTPQDATRTLAVAVAAEEALESGQTVPVESG